MNSESLESLFQRILAESRGRFVAIARTYSYESEFEDLLQEILLRVWRGLKSFEQQSSIGTWCYRVALNTALTWRRSAGRKRKNIPVSPTEVGNLAVESDGHDLSKLLDRFLSTLNKVDKAVVLMYLEDFSNKQMAEIIGIKEGAIRVRIHRIKQRLSDWSALDE